MNMKILPVLLLAFASSALCAPHPRGTAAQHFVSGQELYFEQPLDHFNYIIDHTWRQRYFLTGTRCVYVMLCRHSCQLLRLANYGTCELGDFLSMLCVHVV